MIRSESMREDAVVEVALKHPADFAKQFTDIDDKASKDTGFYYNPWKERIEYHQGSRMIGSLALSELLGDPEGEFERWSNQILGLTRSGG